MISTGRNQLSHESEAVEAGPLLWVSGQIAGDEDGLKAEPDAVSQLRFIFSRIEDICRAGGTELSNLLRIRGYVTNLEDSYHVYHILKELVPSDPPTVCITTVRAPLQVPGCSVVLDAVAYVPE